MCVHFAKIHYLLLAQVEGSIDLVDTAKREMAVSDIVPSNNVNDQSVDANAESGCRMFDADRKTR